MFKDEKDSNAAAANRIVAAVAFNSFLMVALTVFDWLVMRR
jgi:hypothetical protein